MLSSVFAYRGGLVRQRCPASYVTRAAYNWARPAIFAAGKGRRGYFYFFRFFTFIHFPLSPVSLPFIIYYLFYLSSTFLWETTPNDPQGLMCHYNPTLSITQYSPTSFGYRVKSRIWTRSLSKQSRLRSDAAECGVWSVSSLFVTHPSAFCSENGGEGGGGVRVTSYIWNSTIVRMCVLNSPLFQRCQVYDWPPFFNKKYMNGPIFLDSYVKGPIFLTSWYMHIFFAQRFFEAAYPLSITWIDRDICVTTSK